jgi:peptide-methionine (S)-S-oxide reductase
LERKATFGAGCFWGVEAAFRQVEGVTRTRVGYGGGTVDRPSYEDVCSHTTGHAEVVEVTYDPQRVSYGELLDVFWRRHNPTRRGGASDQYRSVVFVHDEEQRRTALASKAREQARLDAQIVTEIAPAPVFHEAEERHQQYLEKHGRATCNPALAGSR